MISTNKITTIFCVIDDFYKEFKPIVEKYSLKVHLSGVRNLKHFYLNYVKKYLQAEFP